MGICEHVQVSLLVLGCPKGVRMKLRALVVEDEWAARNYLVELLQASGAIEIVGAVTNADDAREVLAPAGAERALDGGDRDLASAHVGSPDDARGAGCCCVMQ